MRTLAISLFFTVLGIAFTVWAETGWVEDVPVVTTVVYTIEI